MTEDRVPGGCQCKKAVTYSDLSGRTAELEACALGGVAPQHVRTEVGKGEDKHGRLGRGGQAAFGRHCVRTCGLKATYLTPKPKSITVIRSTATPSKNNTSTWKEKPHPMVTGFGGSSGVRQASRADVRSLSDIPCPKTKTYHGDHVDGHTRGNAVEQPTKKQHRPVEREEGG